MGNHSVHKSTETGNFVVANKDGQILHTFPSEGEAMLQVQYLDEQALRQAQDEGGAKKEAKANEKNERHHEDEPKHGSRHR